jgi:hypothetical protein
VTAPVLSADGAVAWVRSLSPGVRAVAVLDAAGDVLAGDPGTARRAAAALAADPDAGEVGAGDLLAVRHGAHAVAALLEPSALVRVVGLDLRTAAAALAAGG